MLLKGSQPLYYPSAVPGAGSMEPGSFSMSSCTVFMQGRGPIWPLCSQDQKQPLAGSWPMLLSSSMLAVDAGDI